MGTDQRLQEEDVDELTEMYLERRTLSPNTPYITKVESVDVVVRNSTHADATIQLYLKAGGHILSTCLRVEPDTYLNSPDLTFLSNVQLEEGQFDPREDIVKQLEGGYISLCFDEDLTKCWVPNTDDHLLLEDKDRRDIPRKEAESLPKSVQDKLETLLVCRNRYEEVLEGDSEIWELQVTSYNPSSDREEFSITASESVLDQELCWEFELPDTKDPEEYDSARLIEYVGEGRPDQLEGSRVYAVHHDDIHPLNITTMGTDTTETWHLVTPTDFKEWKESQEDDSESFLDQFIAGLSLQKFR